MKKISVFADGGSRGNPGPAGIGVILLDGKKTVKEFKKYIGSLRIISPNIMRLSTACRKP